MEITAEISLDIIENLHKFAAEIILCNFVCVRVLCRTPQYKPYQSTPFLFSFRHLSVHTHPGRTNPPLVFFNERLIGGSDDLQKLEAEGKLDQMVKECMESPDPDFPPPCRKPDGIEFVKVGISLQC